MPDAVLNRRDPRNTDGSVSMVEHVDAGFITLTQAARYLSISPRTIRRWIEDQGLPHYYIRRKGSKRGVLLFRRRELDRWLRGNKNALASGHALDSDHAAAYATGIHPGSAPSERG